MKISTIETPIGIMIAVASEETLYLLEFIERKGLNNEIERLKRTTCEEIITGSCSAIQLIQEELKLYFAGKLKKFNTPFTLIGTVFQKKVWGELWKIPFSETKSYSQIAKGIEKPTACRAVANANGANQIAIIVPCHRVIHANGGLSDYAAGSARKKWLIEHEKRFKF